MFSPGEKHRKCNQKLNFCGLDFSDAVIIGK